MAHVVNSPENYGIDLLPERRVIHNSDIQDYCFIFALKKFFKPQNR